MTTVYQHKLWCSTDSKWEYVWLPTTPTLCPTNAAHTIDSASVVVVTEVSDTKVKIIEEDTPTQGYFAIEGFEYDVTAVNGASQVFTQSWSFPTNVSAFMVYPQAVNIGDVFSVDLAADTVIGTITSDVTASDTVINVSTSVMENVKIGYQCSLTDGTNTDDLTYVHTIDTVNNTITVDTPAVNSFSASTPTHVRITRRVAKDVKMRSEYPIEVGLSKIGASYVPANYVIKTTYTNNGPTGKKQYINIEYLY